MKQLKFAEQKTEAKLKTFIQSISISSGHDISTYRLYKTVGAFALKCTIYIYIYIYIVLKKSNKMHKFLFYMANRFHVKKQFSKPLNVAFLC